MKKALVLAIPFLCCCLAVSISAQKKVKMNHSNLSIEEGDTVKLKVLHKKGKVKWHSTKKKIAVVDDKGIVRARKAGTAVVVAKIKGKTYKCKIKVIPSKKQSDPSPLSNVNNQFFTQEVYNGVTKVNWVTASKTVTDQKGIYQIFDVLSLIKLEELPQNSEKFVGGITLSLVLEDGTTMSFSLGSNVLLIDNKMYSALNFEIDTLCSVLEKYAE